MKLASDITFAVAIAVGTFAFGGLTNARNAHIIERPRYLLDWATFAWIGGCAALAGVLLRFW